MFAKEPEIYDAELKQRAAYFEDAANIIVDITINSASIITQEKKVGTK